MIPYLRRACDRCHHSKLKCLKDAEEGRCQRCLRANVECIFSPPTTSTSRRQTWSIATPTTSAARYQGGETWSTVADDEETSASTADESQADGTRGRNSTQTLFNTNPAVPDHLQHVRGSPSTVWPNGLGVLDYQLFGPDADMFMDLDECGNTRFTPPQNPNVDADGSTAALWRPPQQTEYYRPSQTLRRIAQSDNTATSDPLLVFHKSSSHASSQSASGISSDRGESTLGDFASYTEGKGQTRTLWLRKISDVNIALTEHLDSSFEHPNPTGRPAHELKDGAESAFTVDRAFHLSQLFIDILGNLCRRLPAPDKGADHVAVEDRLAVFQLDPSAELLIFSAYLRLLETYTRILESIQAAARQNHLERPTSASFQLPRLTVGSFSLSSRSNTQALVLVNVTETMAKKARSLIQEMAAPKMTLGYRGDFESFGGVSLVIVPDLALRAIRAREDALFRMIDDLKSSIL